MAVTEVFAAVTEVFAAVTEVFAAVTEVFAAVTEIHKNPFCFARQEKEYTVLCMFILVI